MQIFLRLFLLSILTCPASLLSAQPYFPVTYLVDQSKFGPYLPRTVQLLHTNAKESPQEVRILVYGQSISEQVWWKEVKHYLEQHYPHANLQIINRAIGGFSSDRLKLMAENDVRTIYPDLILFHDYGNMEDYERIIRIFRRHTTAEVALQTDHLSVGQHDDWHDKQAEVVLPALARKYGLALINVRAAWKEYLTQNHLEVDALLSDGVHLNEHGNYLMAEIIKKHLETLSYITSATASIGSVKVLRAGKDFNNTKNKINLTVEGNRIDFVWGEQMKTKNPLRVKVDRKPATRIPGCYTYTRPSPSAEGFVFSRIGQLLGVQLSEKVEAEEWTLEIMAVDSVKQQLRFLLNGSKTGKNGTGSSAERFVSNSGKIIISPEQWFRRNSPGDFSHLHWVRPGDTLYFQVKILCKDTLVPDKGNKVTVFQGIAPGKHELNIKGTSLSGLREIRVYQPPLND